MGPDQGCLQTTFVLLPVILDNVAEPCFPWGKDRNNGLALRESPNLQEQGPSWAPPTAAPEVCLLAGAEAAVPVTVPSCDWFIVGGLGLL